MNKALFTTVPTRSGSACYGNVKPAADNHRSHLVLYTDQALANPKNIWWLDGSHVDPYYTRHHGVHL
jgi:hypothetical protein